MNERTNESTSADYLCGESVKLPSGFQIDRYNSPDAADPFLLDQSPGFLRLLLSHPSKCLLAVACIRFMLTIDSRLN